MSKIAVAKTEEMTRISKVKFEIHQLYREMNKVYEELGKLAYKHTKNEHMATFSGNKDFFNLYQLQIIIIFKDILDTLFIPFKLFKISFNIKNIIIY